MFKFNVWLLTPSVVFDGLARQVKKGPVNLALSRSKHGPSTGKSMQRLCLHAGEALLWEVGSLWLPLAV